MTFKYLYCTENEWDPESTDSFETCGGYHSAAEQIAEMLDAQEAEYPDKRTIWVLSDGHDIPRKFVIEAEAVRNYNAYEVE